MVNNFSVKTGNSATATFATYHSRVYFVSQSKETLVTVGFLRRYVFTSDATRYDTKPLLQSGHQKYFYLHSSMGRALGRIQQKWLQSMYLSGYIFLLRGCIFKMPLLRNLFVLRKSTQDVVGSNHIVSKYLSVTIFGPFYLVR